MTTILTTIPTTIPTTIAATIPTTIPPTTVLTTIAQVDCDIKCQECNSESNSLGLCISCNKNLGYYNVNYTTENSPNINYYHCHKLSESFMSRFYYNETLDQYRPCYKLCDKCSIEGNADEHNCISCVTNYILKPYGSPKNNCVIECDYFLINAYEQYKCIESFPCPEEAPYMVEDKKACLFNCSKDNEYKYLYNGQCVKECPDGSNLEGYICKVDKDTPMYGVNTFYSEGNVAEEIGNLVEAYSSEFNYTSNYVSIYQNENYEIAIYKNASCLSELSIDMPIIDFQNCYDKIKQVYKY